VYTPSTISAHPLDVMCTPNSRSRLVLAYFVLASAKTLRQRIRKQPISSEHNRDNINHSSTSPTPPQPRKHSKTATLVQKTMKSSSSTALTQAVRKMKQLKMAIMKGLM